MILEMALADSYGIGFEFCDQQGANDLVTYHQHPKYADMQPGHYTDDTQRSLANAQVVLNHTPDNLDIYNPVTYIASMLQTYARDPRPGYSRKFEEFLRNNLCERPEVVFNKIRRAGSNGSVMGAAVLGYLDTPEMVMNAAAAQAWSTHSAETIVPAQIVALSAHYFIERIGPKAELLNYLTSYGLSYSARYIHGTKLDMQAMSVVQMMLYHVPQETSLKRLIEIAVDRGGDTDSSAAIMVAIASCSDEYQHDIPQPLYDNLENGWYGFEHLVRVDQALARIRASGAERHYINWLNDSALYSSPTQMMANSYYTAFKAENDISPVTRRIERGEFSIQHLIALKNFFNDEGPTIPQEDRGKIQKCCAIWRKWLQEKLISC